MRQSSDSFGGWTRAMDGCIVTFLLEDGSTRVEHFNQMVNEGETVTIKSRQKRWKRTRKVVGEPAVEQACARADQLGAKIVTISSPSTILRDLQGTRADLQPRNPRKPITERLQLPEHILLGRAGRIDLLADRL